MNPHPQGNAFSQAMQQHQNQLGHQFQQTEGQGAQMPGGQQGPTFEHYAQLPNVQKGLAIVGDFLNGIGHPLAGVFSQFHQGGQPFNVQPGMSAPGQGPIGQSLTGGSPEGMGQEPLYNAGVGR